MPRKPLPSRRCLLRGAVITGATLPLAGWMVSRSRPAHAEAEDLPEAEDGHAHDYVSNAEDAEGHPEYEAGERCDNCVFWGEEVRNGLGTCNHPDFLEVLVADEGWCSAYASLD